MSIYTTQQVCDLVNTKFNLSVRDKITYQSLRHWRRIGLLTYEEKVQGKLLTFTTEDLINIERIVFVHVVLGVKLSKVTDAIDYLYKFKVLTRHI